MSNTGEVGISDIQIYVPKLRLKAEVLALARGKDPALLTEGLGIKTIARPNADEDTATMGANAAIKVIDRNNIDLHKIKVRIGTESGIDDSKPASTYFYDALEVRYGKTANFALPIENKFACVAGISAVKDAAYAAMAAGERTIVITSDNAKYALRSAGEPTSGAGASAILVEPNPKLLSIDPKTIREFTVNEYDFYKPKFPAAEDKLVGSESPYVNGEHSELVYDFVVSNVYLQIEQHVGRSLFEEADYFVVHVPFVKMAKKAFASAVVHHLREFDREKWEAVLAEALKIDRAEALKKGREPLNGEPLLDGLATYHESMEAMLTFAKIQEMLKRGDDTIHGSNHNRQELLHSLVKLESKLGMGWAYSELSEVVRNFESYSNAEISSALEDLNCRINDFKEKRANFIRAIMKTEYYKKAYAKKAESAQKISSYVGNGYTSSIMFALHSLLVEEYKKGKDLVGKKVLLIGYGSGAGGVGFIATIKEGIREFAESADSAWSDESTFIDIATYEKLHSGELKEPVPELRNDDKVVRLTAVFRDGKRSYAVATKTNRQ
jgi:3-hydroxy-3-methylglutaryl CoA synthase